MIKAIVTLKNGRKLKTTYDDEKQFTAISLTKKTVHRLVLEDGGVDGVCAGRFDRNCRDIQMKTLADLYARSCFDKVQHPTEDAARLEAQRMARLEREPFKFYHCSCCGKWHVAHQEKHD